MTIRDISLHVIYGKCFPTFFLSLALLHRKMCFPKGSKNAVFPPDLLHAMNTSIQNGKIGPPKKLFIFAEYETTQMWSENGTIFRVYKPLKHGSKDTSLCLGFVPQTTEDPKKPKILVDNLDQNCQINRQKRKEVISSTQTLLLYEGNDSGHRVFFNP